MLSDNDFVFVSAFSRLILTFPTPSSVLCTSELIEWIVSLSSFNVGLSSVLSITEVSFRFFDKTVKSIINLTRKYATTITTMPVATARKVNYGFKIGRAHV